MLGVGCWRLDVSTVAAIAAATGYTFCAGLQLALASCWDSLLWPVLLTALQPATRFPPPSPTSSSCCWMMCRPRSSLATAGRASARPPGPHGARGRDVPHRLEHAGVRTVARLLAYRTLRRSHAVSGQRHHAPGGRSGRRTGCSARCCNRPATRPP